MRTFAISTLGCKVNQYESQQIRELLQQQGLLHVPVSQGPDLVVVNTCTVTATASAKSRQFVRKIQRTNPHCVVIVCGCLATTNNNERGRMGDNVHFVQHRHDLAAQLVRVASGKSATHAPEGKNTHKTISIKTKKTEKIKPAPQKAAPELPLLSQFTGQTRAFLKVQDGCDGLCAYCIVPQARSALSSKPVDDVLREAETLVAAGHKEIVVTGVFLGAYSQSTVRRRHWPNPENNTLHRMLDQLARIPGLARIRLSSLEPDDLTETLLEVFCQHPNIVPHLHLSLQSGSDRILKKMCRQYRSADVLKITERVQRFLDRPALTTDIIVGFPGETEDDFEQTVTLAKTIGFAKIHVFAFSARQGTAAARMSERIHGAVIQERSRVLRKIDSQLARRFRDQFLGEACEILTEKRAPGVYGRCERYFKVYLEPKNGPCQPNELVKVRLDRHFRDGVIGTPLRPVI